MDIEFYKFEDKEPKLQYEETLIKDDGNDKGISVYSSEKIIFSKNKETLYIGKYKKEISNYDNRVEELYVEIESETGESYMVPKRKDFWAYLTEKED